MMQLKNIKLKVLYLHTTNWSFNLKKEKQERTCYNFSTKTLDSSLKYTNEYFLKYRATLKIFSP